MLVHLEHDGLVFALARHFYGYNFRLKTAFSLGGGGPALALGSETVLGFPADMPFLGHILGGLAHAVGVVHGRKLAIDKTPAEGRILHLERSPVESALGFGDHKRGAGHTFDPTGHEDL